MIELKNINKYYGNLHVLKNVSLSVNKGEIIAIIGPSGAGKTTLLQILGTLDKPDSGNVEYDGIEVSKLKDKQLSAFRNKNIGFVFQFHQLLPEFTALENVMIPALIAGETRNNAKSHSLELLSQLGLSERENHKPAAMSGGEKQRTAVARALVNNPKVILADEPTGSLDSKNRHEIEQLFSELRSKYGHTIVIVTHDPSLASIADRVVNMVDGRISEITSSGQPTEN